MPSHFLTIINTPHFVCESKQRHSKYINRVFFSEFTEVLLTEKKVRKGSEILENTPASFEITTNKFCSSRKRQMVVVIEFSIHYHFAEYFNKFMELTPQAVRFKEK